MRRQGVCAATALLCESGVALRFPPHSRRPPGSAKLWTTLCVSLYLEMMKFTQYFEYMRLRPDRCGIRMEWIQRTIDDPDAEEVQSDGRIRRWKKIQEAGGKYLRVVLLEDGETVHNAFFDRRFQEQTNAG